jgi:carbonic anhydrase/acetyltransferase-like protein (isoleucine patch superfamily)
MRHLRVVFLLSAPALLGAPDFSLLLGSGSATPTEPGTACADLPESCVVLSTTQAASVLGTYRIVATPGLRVSGDGVQVGAGATLGPDLWLQASSTVAPRASLAGRDDGPTPQIIGIGASVGRRTAVGVDGQLGDGATLAADVVVGDDFTAGTGAVVGYGATVGHRVTVGAGAVVGNLSDLADDVNVGGGATIGRDGTVGAGATVDGTLGSRVTVGDHAEIAATARVASGAQIGANAVVPAHTRVGRGATVGARAVLGEGAVLRAGAVVADDSCVDAGDVVPRGGTVSGGCPQFDGVEDLRVTYPTTTDVQFPSVAAFGNGNVAVFFRQGATAGGFVSVYTPAGAPVVTAVPLAACVNGTSATSLPDGRVAVALTECSSGQRLQVAIVDATGAVALAPTTVSSSISAGSSPSVASFDDGTLLVAFRGLGDTTGPNVARVSAVTGAVIGYSSLPSNFGGNGLEFEAIRLPSGDVLVAHLKSGAGPSDGNLVGATVSASGVVTNRNTYDSSLEFIAGNYTLEAARLGTDRVGLFYKKGNGGVFLAIGATGLIAGGPHEFQASGLPTSIAATQVLGGDVIVAYRAGSLGNAARWRRISATDYSAGPIQTFLPSPNGIEGQADAAMLPGGRAVLAYRNSDYNSSTASPLELLFLQ